jgi:hypothetical protein
MQTTLKIQDRNLFEKKEEKKKPKIPLWWVKVVRDIERAISASREAFMVPGTILGYSGDTEDNREQIYVRLENEKIGVFDSTLFGDRIKVGAVIKGTLPPPENLLTETDISEASFAFETIREHVRLVPPIWLRKVIRASINGEEISWANFFKPFPEWVFLPKKVKRNKALINALYGATAFEGLKGLARYNDLAGIQGGNND